LAGSGHQAFLAGGCVRDLLLHREPADYDVSTDATPEQVLALFPQAIMVGAQFGVVIVPEDDHKVEVATFRSEAGYSDGRHPDQVRFTLYPEEDVRRRDFTINGLLMRPESDEVLDYVGGQADLRAGVIRAIGDPARRFAEDKLRMMRAVRFAARFGFRIEPSTFDAIRKHARTLELPLFRQDSSLAITPHSTWISAERIRDELTKLLTEGGARRGFELLDETGLLRCVLPEVSAMKGVTQPSQFHPEGDVWVHTCLMLEGLPAACSPTLAWGVLLHDAGKPPTFKPASDPADRIRFDGHVEAGMRLAENIGRRMHFSKDEVQQIVALVANHMRFKDVTEMRLSTLKRFVRLPLFQEHLELHRLDCLASHGNMDTYQVVSRFLAETPREVVRPSALITGSDLLSMGLKPGPLFGEILQTVEDAQLDGQIATREEALNLAKRRAETASIGRQ
jgi:poly(A) polymerase